MQAWIGTARMVRIAAVQFGRCGVACMGDALRGEARQAGYSQVRIGKSWPVCVRFGRLG